MAPGNVALFPVMSSPSTPSAGTLFVVATPIGNLADITLRALRVLAAVDVIAAEDTRHTRKLLAAHGISTPMVSCHRHRERRQGGRLIGRLLAGEDVAVVADAGTPGINDPGARLVSAARAAGIPVSPVPGPSSLAAALSVAGELATGRDVRFCGFPPARSGQRRRFFQARNAPDTVVLFFEAPHRIRDSLADCLAVYGDCRAVVCRELTKAHEQVAAGRLAGLLEQVAAGAIPARGEFVVLLAPEALVLEDGEVQEELRSLLAGGRTTLREAVATVAARLAVSRSRVYRLALALQQEAGNSGRGGREEDG